MAQILWTIYFVFILAYFNHCTVLAAIGVQNLNQFSKSYTTLGKDALQDKRVRELANSLSTVERIREFIEENKDSLSQEFKHRDTESSENCWRSLIAVYRGIANNELWALAFLDAMGKPESGILEGSLTWIGSYEVCKSIEVPKNLDVTFGTKTCLSVMNIPVGGMGKSESQNVNHRSAIFEPDPSLLITHGTCVPDTCSELAPWIFAWSLISEYENATVWLATCEDEYSLEGGAIGFICMAALFFILITAGTICDIYVYQPSLLKTSAKFPSNLTNITALHEGDSRTDISESAKKDPSAKEIAIESATPTNQINGTISSGVPVTNNKCDVKGAITNVNNGPSKGVMPVQTNLPKYVDPMLNKESITITDMDDKKPISDTLLKFVVCFSVYTNGTKLLSTKASSGTLQCIHGIRFFSISWVILGHTYSTAWLAIDNRMSWVTMPGDFLFQAILNGTYSVDTFFLLSGLLVTYLFLKEKAAGRNVTFGTMLHFYFHRFWRLTPVYMICLWFFTCFYQFLGEGGLWLPEIMGLDICKDEWWKNLLYIGNLWDTDEYPLCFGHSWYLSNDMQMYWIAPLILIPLVFDRLYVGIGGIILLIVTHIVSTMAIYLKNDFDPFQNDWKIYVKPWCRIGVYAIGMALGYILYKTKLKFKLKRWQVACGWILAGFLCLAPLFASYPYNQDIQNGIEQPWSPALGVFYETCSKLSWGIGVGIIIFICVNGYGGIVNTLLSWKALVPLARLSYCAYLIHPTIQGAFYQSRHRAIYYDHSSMVMYFFGYMVMTFLVSAVISLAFEAPMIALEKFVLGKSKK